MTFSDTTAEISAAETEALAQAWRELAGNQASLITRQINTSVNPSEIPPAFLSEDQKKNYLSIGSRERKLEWLEARQIESDLSGLHTSISHCGGWVIGVGATASRPGVDWELAARELKSDVVDRISHSLDSQQLKTLPPHAIWVLRESAFKTFRFSTIAPLVLSEIRLETYDVSQQEVRAVFQGHIVRARWIRLRRFFVGLAIGLPREL